VMEALNLPLADKKRAQEMSTMSLGPDISFFFVSFDFIVTN
jgi:hypothetical protein